MKAINAAGLDFSVLNQHIRKAEGDIAVSNCLGQRYIAAGLNDKRIQINGIPGNALGAYLNGAQITVNGNAQDAVGDTMNDGEIIIYGNIGDAAGYAMRGGRILIKGNAGYRAGIHMKEYGEKRPFIVIGGSCGSFLGEYQAGGIIIVLGLGCKTNIVGDFPCTGMHGGKMFLRSDCDNIRFPKNAAVRSATDSDMAEIDQYITKFCETFGYNRNDITQHHFMVVVPDSMNPYKQMYVAN